MRIIIISIMFVSLLMSCAKPFYQLYKTESQDIHYNEGLYSFSNEDLTIVYDLWRNKGDGSFFVLNNSDKEIFVDLGRSHLIINGIALTYFQSREMGTSLYSHLIISGTSVKSQKYATIFGSNYSSNTNVNIIGNSTGSSEESSIVYKEKRIIVIPPESGKVVYGFFINEGIFSDCDMKKYPKKKDIKTLTFERESSPLIVRNFITYSFSEILDSSFNINNEFWITEITNYPHSEFSKNIDVKECDTKKSINIYKYKAPNNFYVRYKQSY